MDSARMAPRIGGLELQRGPLLSFLWDPYLVLFGGFLAVMISLSFSLEPLHHWAMRLRWPVLGFTAIVGLGLAAVNGLGRITAAHAAMLVFLFLATASSAYSIDARYSFERAVSIGLLYTATFFGAYSYCQSLDNTRKLTDLLWCIGAMTVLAGAVFSQAKLGVNGRYEGIHGRATGAGTFAAIFLPLAIYQVRYRFRGIMAVFGWFITLLLLAQIVLAGARMAIVTAGFVSVALWINYYGTRAYAAAFALLLLIPAPFILNPQKIEDLQQSSQHILRTKSISTFTGRLDRWIFGLEQFSVKPLYGHGLGASRTLAGLEDPRRFDIKPGEVFNLHSDQIEVLMDTGILGFMPFAFFWLVVMATGAKIVTRPENTARQLALAYFGSVLYAFGDTFMHGGFLAAGGGVSAYTWTMIAAFLALTIHAEQLAHVRRIPPVIPSPAPVTAELPTAKPEPTRPRLPTARRLARV